jgi:hypothetical protein
VVGGLVLAGGGVSVPRSLLPKPAPVADAGSMVVSRGPAVTDFATLNGGTELAASPAAQGASGSIAAGAGPLSVLAIDGYLFW